MFKWIRAIPGIANCIYLWELKLSFRITHNRFHFVFRLSLRSFRIELTPSSTISLHSYRSITIPNRFPIFPMDVSFIFVEREAKRLSHWKGKVAQRIGPTLFLLDDSVFVTCILPMPFQPSDSLVFFNIHLVYYCLGSIKLICMCSSSTVFLLDFD